MPVIRANGASLYTEVYGVGVPLLGIHGTPSSAMVWQDAAQRLATVGRCIIYDRRGFLRSDGSETGVLDLSQHVEDAAALLDALDAAPAIVIGRSTGGLIALELARQFPAKVRALVLLEPALFTLDPSARQWAGEIRRVVLAAAEPNPSRAAEAVIREALGDAAWEALPAEVSEMFTAVSDAVLAEIRGQGLDLSAQPLELSDADLAGIAQPALLVTAEDSPEALHHINDHLAKTLPRAEKALVPGGHLIDPAHPLVLAFIRRVSG